MIYIISAVQIALVAVFLLMGYRKGFAQTVISFAAPIIAFLLAAIVITTPVTSLIFPQEKITDSFSAAIEEELNKSQLSSTMDEVSNALTESLGWIGKLIPDEELKSRIMETDISSLTDIENYADFAAGVIYEMVFGVMRLVVMMIAFFILTIVIRILGKIFAAGLHIVPLAGSADRLVGGALGLISGVVISVAATYLVMFVWGMLGDGAPEFMTITDLQGSLWPHIVAQLNL